MHKESDAIAHEQAHVELLDALDLNVLLPRLATSLRERTRFFRAALG